MQAQVVGNRRARGWIAGAVVATLAFGAVAAEPVADGAIAAKVDAHRSAVAGFAATAERDDSLERQLRFRAAVARDPGQYVWIACQDEGRSLRIVHGEDFGVLHPRSMAEVARVGWSSLLQPGHSHAASQLRCGEYVITATEGYFDKHAFPVVSVARAGAPVVPPTALSFAMCAQQFDAGASVDHCPDLNARIVAARYDAESELTHVVLTGSFALSTAHAPEAHYTLYQE